MEQYINAKRKIIASCVNVVAEFQKNQKLKTTKRLDILIIPEIYLEPYLIYTALGS